MTHTLLLVADAQPDPMKITGSRSERLRVITRFHAPLDCVLRIRLAGLELDVEQLVALGSWVVRGSAHGLAELRKTDGPLKDLGIHVLENGEFYEVNSVSE